MSSPGYYSDEDSDDSFYTSLDDSDGTSYKFQCTAFRTNTFISRLTIMTVYYYNLFFNFKVLTKF